MISLQEVPTNAVLILQHTQYGYNLFIQVSNLRNMLFRQKSQNVKITQWRRFGFSERRTGPRGSLGLEARVELPTS